MSVPHREPESGSPADVEARVNAARAATRFAIRVREAGSLAWRIYVGSDVHVSRSSRVPAGWYRVVKHYTSAATGVAKVDLVDPLARQKKPRVHDTIISYLSTVAPNWGEAFAGSDWGDAGPILAGACRNGLGPVEWLTIADWLEEEPGDAFSLGRAEQIAVLNELVADAGVPLSYFLNELRGAIASNRSYHGQPTRSAVCSVLDNGPAAVQPEPKSTTSTVFVPPTTVNTGGGKTHRRKGYWRKKKS